MDGIDVQWTIAITEALHLGGEKVACLSVKGSQSCRRLTSSLFLLFSAFFFFLCVSELQRMTANYRVEPHIGAMKSKAGGGERGVSLLQVVARNRAV